MSNSIYDILGFYTDPKTFVLGARSAISDSQKKTIQNAANRLWTVVRSCQGLDDKKPDAHVMDAAFRKFKSSYLKLNVNDFSARETRALIYNMHLFNNDGMFASMAKLLDANWKNRFFNGLLFYLLTNWDSVDNNNLQVIIDLFQEKITHYDGKRDKYLLLQQNARFLNSNGAELLGMTLRKKDVGQTDSCSILTASSVYFGLNGNKIDLEYYSKVIVSYFGRDAIKKLDLLRDVLKLHNYDVTAKRIIPSMIIQNKEGAGEAKQEYIRALAVGMIGNPELASKWTMRNGTPEERQNLEEARLILNEWLKKKFISIFFEKCVHEPLRQKYWLKHIDMIEDLEIWCTPFTMSLLLEDKRISDLLNSKVKVLDNEKDADMSVLIMTIGNYYFIEFSDVGCLYLLQRRGPYGGLIASNRIMYFSEIKSIRVNLIQDFYVKTVDGKIDHRSGWESTLEKWMKYHRVI